MGSATRVAQRLFGRYLLVTNTISCGVLMSLGDVTVQSVERWADGDTARPINWARTGRMFSMGLVMGPFNHKWYGFLDRILPLTNTSTVVKKILADQIVASPFFAFTFFMGTGTLEGQKLESSFREFYSKFWDVYKADWTLWPAAQAVNFYFIPSHLRVIYVAIITLCWNTFLSYMKHKDQEKCRDLCYPEPSQTCKNPADIHTSHTSIKE